MKSAARWQSAMFRYSVRGVLAWVALACLALAVGRMIVLVMTALFGPALPHNIVAQLRVGMDKAQVEVILGPPTSKTDECWYYKSWWNPGWVEVYFDSDRLLGINDESAFPNEYGRASIHPAVHSDETCVP